LKEREKGTVNTNDIYGVNLGIPINIISDEFEEKNIDLSIKISDIENRIVLGLPDDDNEMYFEILDCYDNRLNDINLFFINAERKGPRVISEINEPLTYSVGNTGENTAYVICEMDKRQKIMGLKLPDDLKISELDRFSANCEEWLKLIIPETELTCSADIEKNIATIKFKNKGEFYLPTATGFGITYVLPIIVQALTASMLKNSVLIVENPEAHLHPYSQSQLGKFLAFVALNGVQILVETHSEHIVDGCRIQMAKEKSCDKMEVLFFEKMEGNCSCRNIKVQEDGELEEWPAGFFDQKRQDLRELLEIRKCQR
jgi:predicted ATPase